MKPHNTDDSALWLVLGAVLGFAAIGLLGMFPFVTAQFFEKYDVIVGSFLALLAAAFAFYSVLVQIRNSNAIEKDRLLRRERASRALLPFALSQVSEYGDDCIKLIEMSLPHPLDDWHAAIRVPHVWPSGYSLPPFPDEALTILKECVESCSAEPASHIAELMEALQIHKTRFESFCLKFYGASTGRATTVFTLHSLIRHVVDALKLNARCDLLFLYARRRGPVSDPLTRDRVIAQARLVDLEIKGKSVLLQQINTDFNFKPSEEIVK